MQDGMQYDPIQDQGQDHEPLEVVNPSIFQQLFPLPFTVGAGI